MINLKKIRFKEIKAQNAAKKKKYNSLIKRISSYKNYFVGSSYRRNFKCFQERLIELSRISKLKVLQREMLDDSHIKQIFNITRLNMKFLYDQNPWGEIWANGWNDDSKLQELSHKACNYIIIYNENNTKEPGKSFEVSSPSESIIQDGLISDISIVSFLCFRIELEKGVDQEKLDLVGYMYELQSLDKGKGYGKFLVDLFYEICKEMKLEKIMCTVLKKNVDARRFYEIKCGFKIDEISPNDEPYIIMSKDINY